MVAKANLTGRRYTNLTVVGEFYQLRKNKAFWLCECSCGNYTVADTGSLQSGNTKSCGCYKRMRTSETMTTHGLSKTKEYSHWSDMKKRCTNPNNQDYKYYSLMHHDQEMLEDFTVFLSEIGRLPENKDVRWSIGRKNNLLGYIKGNIEWQEYTTQARNHCKQVNNTSGVTGVMRDKKSGSWYAQWTDLDGIKRQKYFGKKKYGERAFALACEYREQMIKALNEQGAGYADTHGVERGVHA